MSRYLVQLCHQRMEWVLINQRNLYVIILTKDLVECFPGFYASITSTNNEDFFLHMLPSRCSGDVNFCACSRLIIIDIHIQYFYYTAKSEFIK